MASGTEGISLITQQPFDLVYLDIRMPDMNGLDVLKTVHAQLPELPVILFTAQPDLHSAVEALRRGAIDYFNEAAQAGNCAGPHPHHFERTAEKETPP